MRRPLLVLLLCASVCFSGHPQGLGIPTKTTFLGFGNLPKFTGVRLNWKDRNVQQVNGINVTAWIPKDEDAMEGTINGISIGAPLAANGSIHGIGVGIFGVGARRNLYGINAGGLGVGAGGNVKGINVGGLGVGSGGNLLGINVGGLGVGSGGRVTGINVGGLGVGSGSNLYGINVGGLGVGAGGNVSGISVGGLGVGSGGTVKGISIAILGVGAGESITGINIAGVGVGAGKSVNGLSIAGVGVGSPVLRGVVISAAAGGNNVSGFMIVPGYFRVGDKKNYGDEGDSGATMKGVSISAFNQTFGNFNGVSIGVVNWTRSQRGLQLGLINIVKSNPPGLRVLPIFNTSFK